MDGKGTQRGRGGHSSLGAPGKQYLCLGQILLKKKKKKNQTYLNQWNKIVHFGVESIKKKNSQMTVFLFLLSVPFLTREN